MKKKRYNKVFWIGRILFIIACIAAYIYFFYEKDSNKKLKTLEVATDKVFFVYSGVLPMLTFKNGNFVKQLDIENPAINQKIIDAMQHGLGKNIIYEVTGNAAKSFVSTLKLIMPPFGTRKSCACLGNPKVLLLSKGKLLTSFQFNMEKEFVGNIIQKEEILI